MSSGTEASAGSTDKGRQSDESHRSCQSTRLPARRPACASPEARARSSPGGALGTARAKRQCAPGAHPAGPLAPTLLPRSCPAARWGAWRWLQRRTARWWRVSAISCAFSLSAGAANASYGTASSCGKATGKSDMHCGFLEQDGGGEGGAETTYTNTCENSVTVFEFVRLVATSAASASAMGKGGVGKDGGKVRGERAVACERALRLTKHSWRAGQAAEAGQEGAQGVRRGRAGLPGEEAPRGKGVQQRSGEAARLAPLVATSSWPRSGRLACAPPLARPPGAACTLRCCSRAARVVPSTLCCGPVSARPFAPQDLAALKQKAGEKGAFGGKGLSYSGKK